MKTNLRIGEILIELGYVTEEQLQQALVYQKDHRDKRVGQLLQEMGFITQSQMLEALADRLNLEIVDVTKINIDMDAVQMIPRSLAEKSNMMAVGVQGNELLLVTNDPLNYFALEEVRQLTDKNLNISLSELEPLQRAIAFCYTEVAARQAAQAANIGINQEELDMLSAAEDDEGDQEAPIVKLLNSLVERAASTGASDIHIEPFETRTQVRMRVDGVIVEYVSLKPHIHKPLIARIKILSNLDIAERRLPQDGHFRSFGPDGKPINIRVSLLPTVHGEKAVLRLLVSEGQVENHSETFGMDEESYNKFRPILNCQNGIIYITGPTGSGKSTTLYMILDYLSKRQVNISTVEDPVEKTMPRITQTQVNVAAGMTFEKGLRALLRQDPDIIMVGETRDTETAKISVRASITGHIVLSTLHTNDAISSIVRLADMGVEPYLIANSLVGLVAQRLMRKNCAYCAEEVETTEEERKFLGEDIKTVRRGKGCPRCNGTGYKGRIAVHEIVPIDRNIRRLISKGAEPEEIEAYARKEQNMHTLKEKGTELVKQGVTTPEELLKIAYYV